MNQLIKGQEKERERIAKDLHDSLGGLLSAIKLKYDTLIYQNGEAGHALRFRKCMISLMKPVVRYAAYRMI
ncbi:MAG: histidine kinase dimerization/phosphoacceptor domain-containing protein [Saprospiraceae bacterium]